MKHYRSGWALGLWVCCFFFVLGNTTRAQSQAQIELSVTAAFEDNYTPGTWLPLRVNLKNTGPAFIALVAASLPGNPNRYTTNVDLPVGSEKATTIYVAMEQTATEVNVVVANGTSEVARQTVPLQPRIGERLLGLASTEPLALSLPRRQDLFQLPFNTFPLRLTELPEQAAGLRSMTTLLVADPPADILALAQTEALIAWVYGGGHLVLGGGAPAQAIIDRLPDILHAAIPGAFIELDSTVFGDYVGKEDPSTVQGLFLQPLPGSTTFGPSTAPLWVDRAVGNGRVTQLAFDPRVAELATWADAPAFWDKLLQPLVTTSGLFGLEIGTESRREQALTTAVGQLPALNLPQSRPLFGLLLLYTLVIGPGIALVLRRFDRQVSGWLVLPGIALLFLGLGCALAANLRADQRIVSQVNLIEQVGPDLARARSITAMLAPQKTTFDLKLPLNTLLRSIRSVGGPYGQIEGANGSFDQQGEAAQLEIERWKFQGVVAEQQLRLPTVPATITFNAEGISVEVRNTLTTTLREVVVAYGQQIVRFGDLEPGQAKTERWPYQPGTRDEPPGPENALSYLALRGEIDASRAPGMVADRNLLLREALLGVGTIGSGQTQDPGPWLLARIEQSPVGVQVTNAGAARQEMTQLVGRATIAAEGTIGLPSDWLQLDLATVPPSECTTSGAILASTTPLTASLRLPAVFAPLETTGLTLTITSNRTWPNAGIRTELYDWQDRRWVEQDYEGPGELVVATPERFLRNGQTQIRFDGRVGETGCISIRSRVAGTLP